MTKLTVVSNQNLQVLTGISELGKGTYRAIVKVQAGFLVATDISADSPIDAFRRFNLKALQSLGFVTEHGMLTVYAKSGKKVWATEQLLANLKVADINQDLSNTGLYSQAQYQAVGAKTWADKAFVKNN